MVHNTVDHILKENLGKKKSNKVDLDYYHEVENNEV